MYGNFKVAIFDLDGVIANTEDKKISKVKRFMKSKFKLEITKKQINSKYKCISPLEFFVKIQNDYKVDFVIDDHLIREFIFSIEDIDTNEIIEIEGAKNVLKILKENKYKIGISSGSSKNFIKKVIASLDLAAFIDVYCSSEEVAEGKPSPLVFLESLSRINDLFRIKILPKECIVFEDSKNGISAAKKAGMFCIGLTGDNNINLLSGADKCIQNFSELNIC